MAKKRRKIPDPSGGRYTGVYIPLSGLHTGHQLV